MNILVVDDEKEIADVVELYLQNDQYKVFKFYNGQDALDCINSTKIDLAILDIMLPDGNGLDICRRFREKKHYPLDRYSNLCYTVPTIPTFPTFQKGSEYMKNAKRKYLFGLVRLSDKGQIVIPKEAREVFGLKPGDQLLLLGDVKKGMALVKVDECGLVEKISGEVFENERPEESGTDEKTEGGTDA